MHIRQWSARLAVVVACLFFAGCDDSKNPLSDPQKSKSDPRLAGVWRQQDAFGDVTFYHVGRAGEQLPDSVMRVVTARHDKNGQLHQPGEFLIFPTTLEGAAYLNLTSGKEPQIKLLKERGWASVDSYFILKYKVEGDTLLVWFMNNDAKKKAIESGKLKGVIEKQDPGGKVKITDTTENVARFVAGAGDSLFSKETMRLERVK